MELSRDELSLKKRFAGKNLTRSGAMFLEGAESDIYLLVFMSQKLNAEFLIESVLSHFQGQEPKMTANAVTNYLFAVNEMFFTRYIDNFSLYLVNILREVLRKEPRILSSSERVTMERLLKAASLDEVIAEAIEETISNLSYKGFDELELWFKNRNIPLEVSGDRAVRVRRFIAMRNLFVHNRGRADAKFVRQFASGEYVLGQHVSIDVPEIGKAAEEIGRAVTDTDHAIQSKFALPTVTISAA